MPDFGDVSEIRAPLQMLTQGAGTCWQRDASKESYLAHGNIINTICPTEQGACDERGNWVQNEDAYDVELKGIAHGRGQSYVPVVRIASRDAFRAVLDSPALTKTSIDNLVKLATERPHDGPWDGVDIDIELADDAYKDKLTGWLEAATVALHDAGLPVSFDAIASDRDSGLPGGRHGIDFGAIGEFLDGIMVMCYTSFGMNPNTAPGAYDLADRVLEYVLGEGVPPEKLYAGLAITPKYLDYGLSVGAFVNYSVACSVMDEAGVTPQWYAVGDDGRLFELKRAVWADHEVWVIDGDTLQVHLRLVDKYGIAGMSPFVLGSESPTVWPVLAEWASQQEQTASGYSRGYSHGVRGIFSIPGL
jgi:spore germination protein YaaH